MPDFDMIIRGGRVVDGSGAEPFAADVAIRGGRIASVGRVDGTASEMLDADGALVTPGFIDIHTHYDGQVSWDPVLAPSVQHGVTTVVMGSCGVGFAPCRATDRDRLIRLMEGVEDIPGVALSEGITWDWESLEDYMDAIDVPHAIDFAVQVTHDPLRVYVMGDRAEAGEPARDDDIAAMRDLTRRALEAGAIGFTTGRTDLHRTADGEWTPASEATGAELAGIARAFEGLDHGVLQAVNDFDLERDDPDAFAREFAILESFARAGGGRPFSLSLMQRDFAPGQWRRIIEEAERLKADGVDMHLQTAPRGIGVILGLQCTFHPFIGFPSYKAIAHLPLAERVAAMKDPAFKKRLLLETSEKMAGDGSAIPPLADKLLATIDFVSCKLFKLGDPPDYEQSVDNSVYKMAERAGVSPLEMIYDILLEDEGRAFLYFPIYNYTDLNYQAVHEMMTHPQAIMGLSDGGAHVGTICDASFPTYLLAHWTKPRSDGRTIAVEQAVHMLTGKQAAYLGLTDRGLIREGMKADINVIAPQALRLHPPRMVQDLPAGGQRLLQAATGYRAMLVSGKVVVRDDRVTDARPGRLVRAGPRGAGRMAAE
ncbi:N-acyl-D-amino-acid deacylase family protein [Yunchengibacter salinarum]|uniref:N-acyl-D-amino-acid deacylase family protein n=1 Tax=Yunchengibacter salinarum TaxID=3133399 RepID=UPI0035B5D4CC